MAQIETIFRNTMFRNTKSNAAGLDFHPTAHLAFGSASHRYKPRIFPAREEGLRLLYEGVTSTMPHQGVGFTKAESHAGGAAPDKTHCETVLNYETALLECAS